MALPLMPKATAVWLVENTALTFEQIAEFCGMHELEIQAIADDEVASNMVGWDPVINGQLTPEEIKKCENDPSASLTLKKGVLPDSRKKAKGAKYTPVARRQDKPDAISWLLKHHPELSTAQICKLIGTTKKTVEAIRDKSHWNIKAIKARNPIVLGLCKEADLEKAIALAESKNTA